MLTSFFNRALVFNRLTPSLLFRFAEEGEGEGSNKPSPTEITKENAQLIIEKWVKENKVVLFMKGTPLAPLCGYSNFVVELLKKYGTRGSIQD